MSTHPIISVEKLGKRYRIGAALRKPESLGQAFRQTMSAPFRYLTTRLRKASEEEILWALKDVSFEVHAGEVVGIIGRNGAGKSTLLKILSRITDPTEGRAIIRGRVNALLEVGVGFHRELTGRENIFMNAAIHGMRREEIRKKLDEIVAFAEIEKFLDTPVKFYSSGMYTRLAFAVAAHLDPDILLVDEVLAVGDMSFQKKCLAKMEDVSRQGRTVLFVSHNMATISSLCSRAVLLRDGRVAGDGIASQLVMAYFQTGTDSPGERRWTDDELAPGNEYVRMLGVRIHDKNGKTRESFDIREPVGIEMTFRVLRRKVLNPSWHVVTQDGQFAFITFDLAEPWRHAPREPGIYRSTVWIPGNLLADQLYYLWANIISMESLQTEFHHVHERDVLMFRVVDPANGETARGDVAGNVPGAVRPLLNWADERLC